ncbi:hypothetical protein J6590_097877 [Homalodisca vitripennis]|nr:hypothetical protein J6590_097877 [Homalodisca vitripennis]
MSDLGKITITGLQQCDDLHLQQAERAAKKSRVEKSCQLLGQTVEGGDQYDPEFKFFIDTNTETIIEFSVIVKSSNLVMSSTNKYNRVCAKRSMLSLICKMNKRCPRMEP